MTDVNYFDNPTNATTPKSSGLPFGLALVGAALVWYFLTSKRNASTTADTAGSGGYGESISGGSDASTVPTVPVAPSPTVPTDTNVLSTLGGLWGRFTGVTAISKFASDVLNTPAKNSSSDIVAMLKKAKVSTDTEGNAALNLFNAMKENPSMVSTVKIGKAKKSAAVAVNPTKFAGVIAVTNPGKTSTVDGTKVTVNSYDFLSSVTGQKYETPKNGFGYSMGPGVTSVAGNVADAIAQNEARLTASKPVPATKNTGNAAQTLAAAMQRTPAAVTTVKLPAAMQAAIDKKTTSNPKSGGSAYNALSAAMATKRRKV